MNFLRDDNSKFIYKKYYNLAENLYYGQIVKTRFLDPNEKNLVISIINKFDLYHQIFLSHSNCERSIIYFSDQEFEIDYQANLDVKVLFISHKNHGLEHRDILGALMSLGIEREMIGDILVSDDLIEVSVMSEISDFIRFNLKSIKKLNIEFSEKESVFMDDTIIEYEDKMITISSHRLDAFVSAAINKSRTDVKTIINRELVKLNYVTDKNPSSQISIGDCISIRGYGRFYYKEYLGESRKEKKRILVRKIM